MADRPIPPLDHHAGLPAQPQAQKGQTMFTFTFTTARGSTKQYTIYGLRSITEARMAWDDHAARYQPGSRLVSID